MYQLPKAKVTLRCARPRALYRFASSNSRRTPLARPQQDDSNDTLSDFPDLMTPDILMDSHEAAYLPPSSENPYSTKWVVRNDAKSMFDEYRAREGKKHDDQELAPEDMSPTTTSRFGVTLKDLYMYPLLTRFVTQQTGKGKIARSAVLCVAGNGDGLVGFGEAKGHDSPDVLRKAMENAVRNMDVVDRFEGRTVWTETEGKLGGTKILLRPRPVGFGLAVNPYIHHIFTAAGIKDASAKVWGSRNPYQVIRLISQMLHPGAAPLGMGNGIGGPGRRLEAGRGMRGKGEIERERGRKMVDLYAS